MAQPLPPFSCTYSPNLPELLMGLNCTIAISTYQAGKVIFISAQDKERLIQLPRNFDKPMGVAFDGKKLAVAAKGAVHVAVNAPRMANNYPKQPNTYDALFLPRAVHFTGELDIHDLDWVNEKLWAVNTRFSCLSIIDYQFSFTPVWKPYFITSLSPTDRCHLNGVAFKDNNPKYVTALGLSDSDGGWRPTKTSGGILIDVEKNKIVAEGLPMPHSPRLYNDDLLVLHSATGDLVRIDPSSGKQEVLRSLDGFVRGMDRIGDYLFIGLSKLRESSSAFGDMPIAKRSLYCGVVVIYLPRMSLVGMIRYENSVEEIYDVKILPGMKRPGLLSMEKQEHNLALTTPDADYWGMPGEK